MTGHMPLTSASWTNPRVLSHETQPVVSSVQSLRPRRRSDLPRATQLGKWILVALLRFGEAQKTQKPVGLRGNWGRSPIYVCCFPTSRVTELALAVERLQNQNLEKDQVNKALTEKLEALVSYGG